MLRTLKSLASLALAGSALAAPAPAPVAAAGGASAAADHALVAREVTIKPKVMIISMFTPERDVWLSPLALEVEYPFAGASPLFPTINCDRKRDVCIITTGEAEINAAATSACRRLSLRLVSSSPSCVVELTSGI